MVATIPGVIFDWNIIVEKPLLKYFSWLLKPIFKSNHLWAMKNGEINLKKEIEWVRKLD